ncbi:MAG: putative monooxygenase [Caproiciproducens sp.]|nr:putative monooxygenase [Caproiciproducens sp.]
MIKIVAKHTIKQGKINDFVATIKPLIKETNQNHRGCIDYELFQDMENPLIFTMIEEWENQSFLGEHMKYELFKETIANLDAYLDRPVEINRYQRVD